MKTERKTKKQKKRTERKQRREQDSENDGQRAREAGVLMAGDGGGAVMGDKVITDKRATWQLVKKAESKATQ